MQTEQEIQEKIKKVDGDGSRRHAINRRIKAKTL